MALEFDLHLRDKMKVIWTGTDSLLLVKFPKEFGWTKIFYIIALRILARLTDLFGEEHFACGDLVEKNLRRFGMRRSIVQFIHPVKYGKLRKKEHKGFNVLYFCPKNSKRNNWIYGYDIFLTLKEALRSVNFIRVDGGYDLKEIYPLTDLYVRPNRHDGHPRMIEECILNEIPYIWTKENPNVEYFVNEILRVKSCGGK